MKYLVRFNKEDNKYVDMVTTDEEYVYKYYNIDTLEEKEGFYIKTYYDEKNDKVDQQYVEIPKTKEEELENKLIRLERVLAGSISDDDLIDLPLEAKPNSLNTRGKAKPKKKLIEPTTDDLAELDNLM